MFSRVNCLVILLVVCQGVISSEEKSDGFVDALDFGPIFEDEATGITSLASNPVAAAVLNIDKSQYPLLFDTVVSSSIDSIQTRIAPRENTFAPENFGFNPIASQGFFPIGKSAKLTAQYNQPQQHHHHHHHPQQHHHHQQQQQQQQQYQPELVPIAQQLSPLRYDIRTVHDANYKVYKPEEEEEGEEILANLKKNPSVAAYFQPGVTEVKVAHPIDYRKEELIESREAENNYKPNPYITGPARIRRYAGGRSRDNLRKSSDEDEDSYDYKAEYISRPKAFDSGAYSSAYKEEKDPKKDYEYPYKYDSGYDHKEYERIKELSEKQAAEIKQNPGNCKEVKKDGMSCMTCKDPKTGGNYESCSYVAEPKNNKYAYSKERKFDSNDEPDEPETNQKSEPKKSEKYQEVKIEESSPQRYNQEKPYGKYKREDDDSGEKYKAYYVHSSKPKTSESLRAASDEESSEKETEPVAKPYDYKKAIPGFYTDNEPKKDVEHVLAEFKKKDRSACKKVQKNGMTCYQCIDNTGLKNEECMFVSESAPKQSHLAYQEVKEFTSKPATIQQGNEAAESQTITTSAPAVQVSASYVVANPGYGKKLKRKKTSPSTLTASATNPIPSVHQSQKVKRSADSELEAAAEIVDESNIAPPEEFAGADSQGTFWAETKPRYSASLGVTLPEYMLSRSEHEASFDETVAGA